ncbi:DUF4976 domain-containing protein [Arcanobacterium hippocoleae]
MKLPSKSTVAVSDAVVELRDVMPTVLDIAGVPIPDSVDGKSVLPLIRGEETASQWRSEIHGEHFYEVFGEESIQWVTNGKRKFIWFSGSGIEQYFDLEADPQELHNLIADFSRKAEISSWRDCLINYLANREEGFVKDGKLIAGQPAGNDFAWVRRLQEKRS